METQPLRAKNAYWPPDNQAIILALQVPPEQLDSKTLVLLVRELDRRFMQLWDKVTFERAQREAVVS